MQTMINTVIGIDNQNNSGGYFINNENVSIYVAVEGIDKDDAYRRFRDIIAPYSSYCECCGERWEDLEFNEWPAPENGLCLNDFTDVKEYEDANCVLHLINGTKKRCRYNIDGIN